MFVKMDLSRPRLAEALRVARLRCALPASVLLAAQKMTWRSI